ncbi:sensor histidine kinase [Chitinophaga solisilvae]|uniref:Sensor histidine kinase n=1 Tax=Chitinophaga solisilvae TaxID=1233460 RepID=A0A9Q5D5V5_9BACT|nr:sensor histidine kinase [Chitinophaga solisilvae]NSL90196.1 sensor histidine kinase [Chitinophaga solisilvae]
MLVLVFGFYFIMYFVLPELILKGHYLAGFFGIIFPFFVNSLINYGACLIVYGFSMKVKDQETADTVIKIAKGGFMGVILSTLSPKAMWFYVSAMGPFVVFKMVLDTIRSATRRLRMSRDKLDLELSFLKSQLNPHFLFNTLNNIYTLSLKGAPEASDLILHLSAMMRYTLYESDTQLVYLRDEVEFMRNYTELERIRYGSRADITFEYDEAEIADQKIGPLLMFPFIENAFKYGQVTSDGQCHIHIKIHANGPLLKMSVCNSKGERPEKKEVGGIGQKNSRKRLELLYPGRHSLLIEDISDKYNVTLSIALSN